MNEKTCFWYPVCPMKRYYEEGRLDEHWVRDYCLTGNPDCVRKKLEAQGAAHPDNMLPDGTIREDLK